MVEELHIERASQVEYNYYMNVKLVPEGVLTYLRQQASSSYVREGPVLIS